MQSGSVPQDTAAAAWLVLVPALAGASAAFLLRLLPRAGITPETEPVATVPELLSNGAGDAGCTTLMAGAGPLAALAIPGAARAAAVATAAAAPTVSKVRIFTWVSPAHAAMASPAASHRAEIPTDTTNFASMLY